ncbi:hypothetical protein L917_08510, partial [Phytophthora nicotianae]
LSPQQTRNILKQVLGSTTLARTDTILDGFADGDAGNDVLFVQDQMDITCVIAMQTSIQKKSWGDTTSRRNDGNGRGIPVIDS